MSRALNPIRQLYSVEPDRLPTESPPTPAEASEREALRPIREALDRLPPRTPDPALRDAVVAAAMAVRAEAEATRPLRDALDALPPQRPEPSLTDAVVTAAMSARLAGVRALYEDERAALAGRAAAEAAALRPVRDALDALPKRRPEPSVIDAVVAAARPAVPTAPDRAARRSPRRRFGGRTAIASTLVLLLAAALTLWPRPAVSPDASLAVNEAPTNEAPAREAPEGNASEGEAPANAPGVGPATDALPPSAGFASGATSPSEGGALSPEPERVAQAARPTGPAAASASRSAPASRAAAPRDALTTVSADADDSDLRLLYLRLQDLEAAGMSWGAPPVELGSEPVSTPTEAPARGWMQVRIEP